MFSPLELTRGAGMWQLQATPTPELKPIAALPHTPLRAGPARGAPAHPTEPRTRPGATGQQELPASYLQPCQRAPPTVAQSPQLGRGCRWHNLSVPSHSCPPILAPPALVLKGRVDVYARTRALSPSVGVLTSLHGSPLVATEAVCLVTVRPATHPASSRRVRGAKGSTLAGSGPLPAGAQTAGIALPGT